uniref:SAM domain-containing protein n=1 Tax=Aplanochytrium stocchinoi TaxID=215587 RepID=A0A7S3LKM3_9STRA|mmetsp:Transcript_3067/g.4146  ORF Transcript_3067/g.4146 Transcript_3067/m.4146 type:complete len:573 (-) Transcript_3067:690-2408(-)|eukprot:CAMPEP_0204823434 /NCGR_PEP_ID=MMETSP1346-20131115/1490_1 /ASSEMBLY_ACC=CAM_ASM_000771 /TAXON_ID=215587 /ORGANISM="Aplanochytrium stocchinoi, Strain GSBS06" /LENGTH=572 /DNA_ID=CAMNT_0051950069 /DNA_START=161 /DNA_END=1879 /DNA_ORIENTATION=+
MDEDDVDDFLMNEFDNDAGLEGETEGQRVVEEKKPGSNYYPVLSAKEDKLESEDLGYPDKSGETDFSTANKILDSYNDLDLKQNLPEEPKFNTTSNSEADIKYPNLKDLLQDENDPFRKEANNDKCRKQPDYADANISDQKMQQVGMKNIVNLESKTDDGKAQANMESQPSEVDHQKRLYHAWNNALVAAGFTDSAANAYSRLFSHLLIDQVKAETITEKFLTSVGVLNKRHRSDLLRLFKKLKTMKRNGSAKVHKNSNTIIKVPGDESTLDMTGEPQSVESGASNSDSDDSQSKGNNLVSSWCEAMIQQGIPVDAAKKYAEAFAEYDVDNTFIASISDQNLKENGILNPQHRELLISLVNRLVKDSKGEKMHMEDIHVDDNTSEDTESTYMDPDEVFPTDFLASCWYGAMIDRGLTHTWAKQYAQTLSDNQIGENNAAMVDDDTLKAFGVSKPEHRKFILELMDSLIKESKKQVQEENNMTVDWESQVEKERQEVEAEIKEILSRQNHFEQQLAAIFSGNTERQKKLRAKRAEERIRRDEARNEARRERALKRAQSEIERLQKEFNTKLRD